MDQIDDTTVWHADGHSIYLQLNKSEIEIQGIFCPHNKDGECSVGKFDCVVEYFLSRFGLDCNVGVSEIESTMEIAWSVQGDTDDPELCQVWIIPRKDETFAAWFATQTPAEEGSEEDVERQDDSDPSPS